ncbi:conserved Plasmodium protein, unknown function [Plasmodium vinckei vinckei]|uniref:Uncharacterized protein n=1 Tax=Plasmodium vinckei vinckei TaxID=54757 RepID=A0A449C0U0_PLAVN|nr:conserved Plasmodium protein, unknown function [Plasmodium vinckei vinckei]VEV59307.1 conserved Plasmodium protein, unknown function [Plasmodium vinckei vinckei]
MANAVIKKQKINCLNYKTCNIDEKKKDNKENRVIYIDSYNSGKIWLHEKINNLCQIIFKTNNENEYGKNKRKNNTIYNIPNANKKKIILNTSYRNTFDHMTLLKSLLCIYEFYNKENVQDEISPQSCNELTKESHNIIKTISPNNEHIYSEINNCQNKNNNIINYKINENKRLSKDNINNMFVNLINEKYGLFFIFNTIFFANLKNYYYFVDIINVLNYIGHRAVSQMDTPIDTVDKEEEEVVDDSQNNENDKEEEMIDDKMNLIYEQVALFVEYCYDVLIYETEKNDIESFSNMFVNQAKEKSTQFVRQIKKEYKPNNIEEIKKKLKILKNKKSDEEFLFLSMNECNKKIYNELSKIPDLFYGISKTNEHTNSEVENNDSQFFKTDTVLLYSDEESWDSNSENSIDFQKKNEHMIFENSEKFKGSQLSTCTQEMDEVDQTQNSNVTPSFEQGDKNSKPERKKNSLEKLILSFYNHAKVIISSNDGPNKKEATDEPDKANNENPFDQIFNMEIGMHSSNVEAVGNMEAEKEEDKKEEVKKEEDKKEEVKKEEGEKEEGEKAENGTEHDAQEENHDIMHVEVINNQENSINNPTVVLQNEEAEKDEVKKEEGEKEEVKKEEGEKEEVKKKEGEPNEMNNQTGEQYETKLSEEEEDEELIKFLKDKTKHIDKHAYRETLKKSLECNTNCNVENHNNEKIEFIKNIKKISDLIKNKKFDNKYKKEWEKKIKNFKCNKLQRAYKIFLSILFAIVKDINRLKKEIKEMDNFIFINSGIEKYLKNETDIMLNCKNNQDELKAKKENNIINHFFLKKNFYTDSERNICNYKDRQKKKKKYISYIPLKNYRILSCSLKEIFNEKLLQDKLENILYYIEYDKDIPDYCKFFFKDFKIKDTYLYNIQTLYNSNFVPNIECINMLINCLNYNYEEIYKKKYFFKYEYNYTYLSEIPSVYCCNVQIVKYLEFLKLKETCNNIIKNNKIYEQFLNHLSNYIVEESYFIIPFFTSYGKFIIVIKKNKSDNNENAFMDLLKYKNTISYDIFINSFAYPNDTSFQAIVHFSYVFINILRTFFKTRNSDENIPEIFYSPIPNVEKQKLIYHEMEAGNNRGNIIMNMLFLIESFFNNTKKVKPPTIFYEGLKFLYIIRLIEFYYQKVQYNI